MHNRLRDRRLGQTLAKRRSRRPTRIASGTTGTLGTTGTTSLQIGATGFEPATFRPPVERQSVAMCPRASAASYVSRAVDDLDRWDDASGTKAVLGARRDRGGSISSLATSWTRCEPCGTGAKPRLPRRVRMLSKRMQERARCLVGGPCCPTALGEELGFGLPQRRRGRLAVQVLRGDRAPVCASAQLP